MTVHDFATAGYAIYPAAFNAVEVAQLRREADRLRPGAAGLTGTTAIDSIRWLIAPGTDGAPVLRGLQYPYRISTVFDDARIHRSVRDIVVPLLGPDVVSVLGTVFWKPAGRSDTVIAYHQDSQFRKPADKFRNLARSYVQLGIALDPHGPANGGMRVVTGSHTLGDLQIRRTTSVLIEPPTDDDLVRLGIGLDQVREVELAPGDVIIWHGHLLHGSPPNRSHQNDRLFYVIGYMTRADADAGEPAFVGGEPCRFQPSTADG